MHGIWKKDNWGSKDKEAYHALDLPSTDSIVTRRKKRIYWLLFVDYRSCIVPDAKICTHNKH
jgi:hypothetical protein